MSVIADCPWLVIISMRENERWDDPNASVRGALGFDSEADALVALDKLRKRWPNVSAGAVSASEPWVEEMLRAGQKVQ